MGLAMTPPPRHEVTQLVIEWSQGDKAVLNKLMPLIQTAEVLDLEPATIKREWTTAKAGLYHQLSKR
jgi:hypothetical protein